MNAYRITLHFFLRGKRLTHVATAWAHDHRRAARQVHRDYAHRGELGHCLGYTWAAVKQGETA